MESKGMEAAAKKKRDEIKMNIPTSIDALLACFENPHIPIEEVVAREEGDFIHFDDHEKAAEANGFVIRFVIELRKTMAKTMDMYVDQYFVIFTIY